MKALIVLFMIFFCYATIVGTEVKIEELKEETNITKSRDITFFRERGCRGTNLRFSREGCSIRSNTIEFLGERGFRSLEIDLRSRDEVKVTAFAQQDCRGSYRFVNVPLKRCYNSNRGILLAIGRDEYATMESS
jgi:hypothetical protein